MQQLKQTCKPMVSKMGIKDKILLIITIGLLLFLGQNTSLDLSIKYLVYFVFIFFSFKSNLLLYIVMMPWETQLLTPLGTFFRTAMVIIFLKWLYLFFVQKQDIRLYFNHRLEFAVFAMVGIYALLAIAFFQNLATLYIFLSLIIFLLFRSNDPQYDSLIKYYIVFTVCGVIWGLITNNFMFSEVDGEIANRFNGTYEPNFMSIYINLAIVMCLYSWKKINKFFLSFSLVLLYIGLLLTMSTTGNLVNVAMLVGSLGYYIYQQPNFSARLVKLLIVVSLVGATAGILYQIPTVYLLTKRVELKIEALLVGNTSEATTGRSDITDGYMEVRAQDGNRVKLFGAAHPEPRVYYDQEKDTHNSFLDLQTTYGALGIGLLFLFLMRRIIEKPFMLKMLIFVLLAGVSSVSFTTFPIFWMLLFI